MSPAATVSISKTLFSSGIHTHIFKKEKESMLFGTKTQFDWQAIEVGQ